MKKPLFLIIVLLSITLSGYSQLRVHNDGKIMMRNLTYPLADVQIIGNTFFTATQENYSTLLSGPYIRGNNRFSTSLTPDFTWYNNDQTGFFHPAKDIIGFSIGGNMRGVITNNMTIFFHPLYISDKRYKENINEIKSPYDILKTIQGVSFNYKPEIVKEDKRKTFYGFIAQDLEKTNPELVETVQIEDVKAVDYNGVVSILVEVVKHQQKEIKELNKKLSEIEKRILPKRKRK